MRIIEGPPGEWPVPERRAAVTIGVYDGVHRGHQHVIGSLVDRARERHLAATVVTFRHHPATVLAPDRVPPGLTTLDQRLELFATLGVDQVALLDFDERLRSQEADAFVVDVLVHGLAAALVSVGEDFRFGHRQGGDIHLLERLGDLHGFAVIPVPLVGDRDPISATMIRGALARGDLDAVARALGRPFQVRGVVEHGDRRGHTIGFPTANLRLVAHQAIPAHGVYAVRAGVGHASEPAVANIGVRPTFDGAGREVVEVHLLGVEVDLYGEELQVDFVARIRDERRFSGIEELVAQITRDVAAAADLLG